MVRFAWAGEEGNWGGNGKGRVREGREGREGRKGGKGRKGGEGRDFRGGLLIFNSDPVT